jgi:predicted PolB exonuclease-like 3'-5' exonuclease
MMRILCKNMTFCALYRKDKKGGSVQQLYIHKIVFFCDNTVPFLNLNTIEWYVLYRI